MRLWLALGLSASQSGVAGPVVVPVNTVAPVVSGTATISSLLSVTNGTWTNSPTGYTYQWQRYNGTVAGWVNIGGATANTYTLVTADAACRSAPWLRLRMGWAFCSASGIEHHYRREGDSGVRQSGRALVAG